MAGLFSGWWQNKEHFDRVVDDGLLGTSEENRLERNVFLIIGRSKAGKSTLKKYLVQKHLKPGRAVYSLNDRTRDDPYNKIEWSKLKTLSRVGVVIEDVLSCKKMEFEAVQELLNFGQNHRENDPIVLVTHGLNKTGLQSLLPFFSKIYVAGLLTAIPAIRTLCEVFGFEKPEKQSFVDLIKNNKIPHAFFVFDTEERTMILHQMTAKEKESVAAIPMGNHKTTEPTDAEILAAATNYLSLLPESKKAIALFQMISKKAPPIDPSDLTVKIRERKKKVGSEKVVHFSVIDYIMHLVTKDGVEDKRLYRFHDFLVARGLKLPRAYVLNEKFWS